MIGILDSETGRTWLEQFKESDQAAAADLALSIRLVDRSEVEPAINVAVQKIGLAQSGSNALFAIREIETEKGDEDEQSHLLIEWLASDELSSSGAFRSYMNAVDPRPSYFPQNPDERPRAVGTQNSVGSEGPVANLIRDICRTGGSQRWLDHPSISEMRNTKTRRIVLIDDIIASGTRAQTFLDAFFNNATMRSWGSFGYLEVFLVAYAAHSQAIAKLIEYKHIHGVRSHLTLESGSPEWSKWNHIAVEKLCHEYAHRTSRRRFPLGYKSAFSTICFDYKCPNTVPAIIWAGSQEWKPLFTLRPRLGESSWPRESLSGERVERALAAVGEDGVGQSWTLRRSHRDERLAVQILAFANRGIRDKARLSGILGIPEDECATVILRNQARGWLSPTGRPTQEGKNELRYLRKSKSTHRADDIQLVEEYYAPRSLRRSRD